MVDVCKKSCNDCGYADIDTQSIQTKLKNAGLNPAPNLRAKYFDNEFNMELKTDELRLSDNYVTIVWETGENQEPIYRVVAQIPTFLSYGSISYIPTYENNLYTDKGIADVIVFLIKQNTIKSPATFGNERYKMAAGAEDNSDKLEFINWIFGKTLVLDLDSFQVS